MSQIHELKIAPHFLKEIAIGNKDFEIRFNDRDFKVGDTLILLGFENETYTGQELTKTIDFILEDYPGLEEGYVILNLRESGLTTNKGINKLVDLCIELIGSDPQDLHYELDICTASDSLVVRKVLNNEQIDVKVSSLCDSGAEFLIDWIYAEEAKEAN